ncbi:MAG: transporter permease, partial [Actinomycetia bacterium]|nr:transporter permease [Actinomycetes bacterium]
MALLSAARRTGDAYERFSARKNAADVVVAGSQAFGFVGNIRLDLVKQLPDIRLSADAFAVLLFTGTTDTGTSFGPSDIFPVAAQSTAVGTSVEGWKLLAGRRADPKNTTEAVASFELAQRLHLKVGSTLKIHFFLKKSFPQVAAQLLTAFPQRLAGHNVGPTFKQLADGPKLAIHVVGIEASPLEFPPLLLDISPLLHLTPAFFHTYSSRLVGSQVSYIRLDDPNKIEPFKAEVERLAHGQPVSFISTGAIQTVKVQRGFRVETTALAIVGVLIALTFLVVAAQGLTRQALAEAGDHPTLRALGMGPRQLRAVTLVRCFAIALPAAAIACIIAVALSPHMLLGLARKADLHPGIHPDGLVFALGALATIAGITITGVVVGRLASRRALPVTGERDRPRRSLLAAVTRGVALPPATAVGMRFALRRDRSAPGVPIWTTVVGAALTVALLVGTWSFTASLRQLINTPHLYGWNWDLRVGAPALPDIGGVIVPALQKNADVSGLSAGTVTQALVHQQRIDLLTVQPIEGVVTPTFVAGRPPANSKEIALGARTMRSWNVKLDDRVTVRIGDASQPFRVVGRAVFPEFGDAGQLGTGAYVTLGGLDRLLHSLS